MPESPTPITTAAQALALIDAHGIVLVSAKGKAPRLTDAIAGEPVKGSWWGHAQGQRIFAILEEVKESDQVLVCRLMGGKLTLVHRRLWPPLARIAARFAPVQLARVREQHTAGGRHVSVDTPFPDWVPAAVMAEADSVPLEHALAVFADCLPPASSPSRTN
jgi:hypothetical protein